VLCPRGSRKVNVWLRYGVTTYLICCMSRRLILLCIVCLYAYFVLFAFTFPFNYDVVNIYDCFHFRLNKIGQQPIGEIRFNSANCGRSLKYIICAKYWFPIMNV